MALLIFGFLTCIAGGILGMVISDTMHKKRITRLILEMDNAYKIKISDLIDEEQVKSAESFLSATLELEEKAFNAEANAALVYSDIKEWKQKAENWKKTSETHRKKLRDLTKAINGKEMNKMPAILDKLNKAIDKRVAPAPKAQPQTVINMVQPIKTEVADHYRRWLKLCNFMPRHQDMPVTGRIKCRIQFEGHTIRDKYRCGSAEQLLFKFYPNLLTNGTVTNFKGTFIYGTFTITELCQILSLACVHGIMEENTEHYLYNA